MVPSVHVALQQPRGVGGTRLMKMGFVQGVDAATVKIGEYRLRLVTFAPGEDEQGMLLHLGCPVGPAAESSQRG